MYATDPEASVPFRSNIFGNMMFVHGDPPTLSQKITDPQFPKIPQFPVPKTQAAAVFIKVLAAFDGETRLQTRGKSSLLLEPLIVECVISI